MGYRHIDNLYKETTILQFRACFALEKVHGTSAHVMWRDGVLSFFSGGEKHERFVGLFDVGDLHERFTALGHDKVTVYGEAYGGSQQAMRATYGDALAFIAFEVQIGETWLSVTNAADVCQKLGIEFVPFAQGPATVEWLNGQRDADSEVAIRRGMGAGKKREGVVVRPVLEFLDHRGNRVMAKHKRDDFRETRTPREVNPDQLKVIVGAEAIAQEWVTSMRLEHVLDKIPKPHTAELTGAVIKAMIEDVEREAVGEIVASAAARKAISAATAKLYRSKWAASL
jgi:hypothetical protein